MKRTPLTLALSASLAVAGIAVAAAPLGADRPAPGGRFALVDRNGDGSLDRAEVTAAAPRWADKFDRIDRNGDERLEPREVRVALQWMGAQRELAKARRQALRAHLAWLDIDGDRSLSRAELGEDAPRLSRDFVRIDTDRNGRLDVEELRAHLAAEGEARRAARGAAGG